MKRLKLLLLATTIVAIGLTTSCRKKKNEEAPKVDTQAQIEAKSKITGKWFIKKAVFTYPNQPTPVIYDHYDATQFYQFSSDGNLLISYEEKQGTFTYKFSEDASTLSIFNPHPNDVYKVKVLTATDLVIEKEHTIDPIMTEEITLSK